MDLPQDGGDPYAEDCIVRVYGHRVLTFRPSFQASFIHMIWNSLRSLWSCIWEVASFCLGICLTDKYFIHNIA